MSLLSLVAIGLAKMEINSVHLSHDYLTAWLNVNYHHPDKYGGHMPCGSKSIMEVR